MKFRMKVTNGADSDAWWETYEKLCDNAQIEATVILDYFNSTLRPHEKPRKLLAVEMLPEES